MPKGRVSTELTGGSGDVNPQTLTLTTTQTGNDASTIIQTGLPIPRLPIRRGRSLVIELLSVAFYHTNAPTIANAAAYLFSLTTNPNLLANSTLAIEDPRTLALWWRFINQQSAVGFSFSQVEKYVDLTDESGHGILVATDNLFFAVYSTGSAVTNVGVAKITYRFKDVSLEEYIGIVQSQQ